MQTKAYRLGCPRKVSSQEQEIKGDHREGSHTRAAHSGFRGSEISGRARENPSRLGLRSGKPSIFAREFSGNSGIRAPEQARASPRIRTIRATSGARNSENFHQSGRCFPPDRFFLFLLCHFCKPELKFFRL